MVAYLWIGRDVVGQKLLVLAVGDATNLVGTNRHAAMAAIDVGIAARTRHQMETFAAMATRIGTFRVRGMSATVVARITRIDHPDATEVEVEEFNRRVDYLLELLVDQSRHEQLLLKPIYPFHAS